MSPPESPDTRAVLDSLKPEACTCAEANSVARELAVAAERGEILEEQAVMFYEEVLDPECPGKMPYPREDFTGCGREKVCGHGRGPEFLGSIIAKIKSDGLPLINIKNTES